MSCMGWEVKINMSGQSNDCLWVCNVKMKKNLSGQKRDTFLRIFGFRGRSVKQFESFLTGSQLPISLTVVDTVVDTFWPTPTRSRWGTWVHTWSMFHCMYLGKCCMEPSQNFT